MTLTNVVEIKIPDIGGADNVDVIEVSVGVGDTVAVDDTLLALESEKASMDIPSPFAGKIKTVNVKIGDKVSEGSVVFTLESADALASDEKPAEKPAEKAAPVKAVAEKHVEKTVQTVSNSGEVHAGPAVRRLANQLGVDLSKVSATGKKGRVVLEDVHQFVKSNLQGGGGGGLSVSEAPVIDFSQFGEVETAALSRIKKISGKILHRNWVTIPHITQLDEADITDLEAFRQENKAAVQKQGAKLTPLVFIMKAVAHSLKAFPNFNASLDASGENLILKRYFHIGIAVDTPNGLVVPVVRDVDQKGVVELALELGEISKKAREGKLLPRDMKGGCFSISSLGGIGGTAFTPIINAPEVAILGVSKSEIKPKMIDGEFKPRLMLPLCLSYDHRVIDGADGARFITHLSATLTDLCRIFL
jgi:pyruvate dehydrogenase E2 component (dihydrolipoamide acetyltransferase)